MNLSRLLRIGLHGLFWPWNLVLCAIALFGYVPFALKDQVLDAVDGLARWDFVAGSVVLIAVPLAATAYAFVHRERYRERPAELAELFFGVELPLLACSAARLFGFHQLSHAAQFVYLALVAGGLVAEGRLVLGKRWPRGQLVDGLSHFFLTLRLVAGVYVGFLLVNLTLPLLLTALVHLDEVDGFTVVGAILVFPVTLFVLGSVLLVLTLPVTAPLAWWHAWKHSGHEVRAAWGLDDLLFTSGAPVVVAVVGFVMFVPQPHQQSLAMLDKAPTSDDERRALVAARAEIEAGLVDAWLGQHTYVSDNSNDLWSRLWSLDNWLVHHSALADVNAKLNAAARPFTFDGVRDEARARDLYRAFFGHEIERDHAEEARAALASTWSREARFAGFINEGQQRVRLESQTVDVSRVKDGKDGKDGKDDAGVFDVEIHDEWVNQTPVDEEVALFFELPESAAVTGLWLSPTSNKADGASFVVAPRGAAQQIYNEEVRAHRDPALLEQVGPQQYRLRVFPIPGRAPRAQGSLLDEETWAGPEAPRAHVWLRYQTLPDAWGHAPLPHLRERRNGFWDAHTVRNLVEHVVEHDGVAASNEDAGSVVVGVDAALGGGWVQGTPASTVKPQVVSAIVDERCLRLTPWPTPKATLTGKTLDVIVDRSLEVGDHRDALKHALQALRDSGATLRFVLGTSRLRGEGAVSADHFDDNDVDAAVFFGAARPQELLQQLLMARGGRLGDAVVVLAGTASFDTATDQKLDLSLLPARDDGTRVLPPSLLVHLSGEMPKGYDDATLDVIRRSGGTASDDIDAALVRLSPLTFVDGHRVDVSSGCSTSTAARPVVARQAILLADRNGIAPLTELDRLHHIATDAGVVTPYSSMIVLLNDTQLARLRDLSNRDDRFEREVEADEKKADDGRAKMKEEAVVTPTTTTTPVPDEAAPMPTAVPEAPTAAPMTESTAEALRKALDGIPVAPGGFRPSGGYKLQAVPARVASKDTLVARGNNGIAALQAQPPPSPIADAPAVAGNLAAQPETVAPTTPTPPAAVPPPQVSGVPEPQEWLLIVLAVVAVIVLSQRRRTAPRELL